MGLWALLILCNGLRLLGRKLHHDLFCNFLMLFRLHKQHIYLQLWLCDTVQDKFLALYRKWNWNYNNIFWNRRQEGRQHELPRQQSAGGRRLLACSSITCCTPYSVLGILGGKGHSAIWSLSPCHLLPQAPTVPLSGPGFKKHKQEHGLRCPWNGGCINANTNFWNGEWLALVQSSMSQKSLSRAVKWLLHWLIMAHLEFSVASSECVSWVLMKAEGEIAAFGTALWDYSFHNLTRP